MKLTVRMRGEGPGAMVLLCDAEGHPLPRQRVVTLYQPFAASVRPDGWRDLAKAGPRTITVEFVVDGDDIAMVSAAAL